MSEWVSVNDCLADLGGFLDGLAHGERLDIRVPQGTLQATRTGHAFDVRLHGQGGGFCWAREWSRSRIVSYVEHQTDDPEVCKREG